MVNLDAPRTRDLIRLVDDEGGVRVHVLKRRAAGTLPGHDWLDVEIEITGTFLQGRLRDVLDRTELAEWASLLGELSDGREVSWRNHGRAPVLVVRPWPEGGGADVTVLDEPSSGIDVRIPIRLPTSWVDDHRALLRSVEEEFPAEVVETSPGAFSWRDQPPANR